jgi:hypothetical protein
VWLSIGWHIGRSDEHQPHLMQQAVNDLLLGGGQIPSGFLPQEIDRIDQELSLIALHLSLACDRMWHLTQSHERFGR